MSGFRPTCVCGAIPFDPHTGLCATCEDEVAERVARAIPVRVQLKRTKGWRMPPNTVKVDRSTKWGNPFVVGETYPIVEEGCSEPIGQSKIESVADAVYAFRPWCDEYMAQWGDLEPLRGKNLACWCALDVPCHADVLLELANADTTERAAEPRDDPK